MSPEQPNLSPKEVEIETLARKKEIIYELRALVKSPGWAYLCTVMEQQRVTVLCTLQEAATIDELLRVNADIREAKTYSYMSLLPVNIIAEFEAEIEASDDDQ